MTWSDDFWQLVHSYRPNLLVTLMTLLVLLILSVFSLLLGEPGSRSYTIIQLNFVLIIGLGSVIIAIYWYSSYRKAKL